MGGAVEVRPLVAFAIAAERWQRDGTPATPGAWLTTTARNRAIGRIRRDRTLAAMPLNHAAADRGAGRATPKRRPRPRRALPRESA
jgi:predicted RNA polymerase sigma factor